MQTRGSRSGRCDQRAWAICRQARRSRSRPRLGVGRRGRPRSRPGRGLRRWLDGRALGRDGPARLRRLLRRRFRRTLDRRRFFPERAASQGDRQRNVFRPIALLGLRRRGQHSSRIRRSSSVVPAATSRHLALRFGRPLTSQVKAGVDVAARIRGASFAARSSASVPPRSFSAACAGLFAASPAFCLRACRDSSAGSRSAGTSCCATWYPRFSPATGTEFAVHEVCRLILARRFFQRRNQFRHLRAARS